MGLFSRKKKTVYDVLDYDFTRLNLNQFEFVGVEVNTMGTEIKKYYRQLDTVVSQSSKTFKI